MQIPPRAVTDQYLARRGEHLDIAFDVDLGELVRGHHVVARGIMLARTVRTRRVDPDMLRDLMSAGGDSDNGGGFLSIRRAGQRSPDDADHEERLAEPELHYEFEPAMSETQGFDWYWMLQSSDDVGTEYTDYNGGAFDPDATGAASHGTRDLGGQVPAEATRLTVRFTPAEDWEPPEPWRREIVVDLRERKLVG